VGHGVQAASPALEKEPAGHAEQASWLVALQGAAATEPAAHEEAQAAQGDMPEALQETLATHGVIAHTLEVEFQL